jgi:hypothetical protein
LLGLQRQDGDGEANVERPAVELVGVEVRQRVAERGRPRGLLVAHVVDEPAPLLADDRVPALGAVVDREDDGDPVAVRVAGGDLVVAGAQALVRVLLARCSRVAALAAVALLDEAVGHRTTVVAVNQPLDRLLRRLGVRLRVALGGLGLRGL